MYSVFAKNSFHQVKIQFRLCNLKSEKTTPSWHFELLRRFLSLSEILIWLILELRKHNLYFVLSRFSLSFFAYLFSSIDQFLNINGNSQLQSDWCHLYPSSWNKCLEDSYSTECRILPIRARSIVYAEEVSKRPTPGKWCYTFVQLKDKQNNF